ncbi:hypothetical protein GALL_94330 [mine drainage metagenome]|uniref:6-phosphogluconate dehydrogenase n=1 Tax=mine drainage metagenome TaxID=410659 RepID=A0A1J5SII4_9ZZZZ
MKKIITIIFVLILSVSALWFWWSYYYTYSDGNRSGLLQKMSHKGNVFKTYEGELILNSLMINGTTPVSSEKFYFSVADKRIGEKLMQFEGLRVILHYQQKKGTLPWRGDSEYIVDSVYEVRGVNGEIIKLK